MNEDNGYPEPTCMICGELCDIVEWIKDNGEYELWCWCKKCEIDTFHQHKDSKQNI